MSFLDKAKDMLNQHDDKVDQALDKGGEAVKGRFAGHEEHIDGAIDRAQGMTGDGDTTQAPPPAAPEEAPPAPEGAPPAAHEGAPPAAEHLPPGENPPPQQ